MSDDREPLENPTNALTDSDRFFDQEIEAGRVKIGESSALIEYHREDGKVMLWNYNHLRENTKKGVPRVYVRVKGKRYSATWGRLNMRIRNGVWSDPSLEMVQVSPLSNTMSTRKHKKYRKD